MSAYRGPAFLDPLSAGLPTGLDAVRATPTSRLRAGVEQVWAQRRGTLPPWLRDLVRGDATSRELVCQGLHDAHNAVLGATWPRISASHQTEFARYALTTAEHGVADALTALCPGSRVVNGCWELPAPYRRHVMAGGRGLLLLPTFHWTVAPLVADNEEHPILVVYPAGPGMPILPAASDEDAPAPVLGSTRAPTQRVSSPIRSAPASWPASWVSAPVRPPRTRPLSAKHD
ncbi:hypothetical protein K1Y78_28400 [Streptomyces sp. tea 10]|nr:hypothetical protein [Streptomyces sp. tea 10]